MTAENFQTQLLLKELEPKARDSKFWKKVVKDIKGHKRIVNIYKINMFAKEGETILVPGKVLSVGNLDKKVDVAALSFSGDAKTKINKNGKCLSIAELFKSNPEGKKVRILG